MRWSATVHALDASAALHAWDHYPLGQFPKLWAWLGDEARQVRLIITDVAMQEIRHRTPDCAAWFRRFSIRELPIGSREVQEAQRIKTMLGIEGDSYHIKGVDENDLLIIASAMRCSAALITNEARQFSQLRDPRKFRIPAVCDLPQVGVQTVSFLGYLVASEQVF